MVTCNEYATDHHHHHQHRQRTQAILVRELLATAEYTSGSVSSAQARAGPGQGSILADNVGVGSRCAGGILPAVTQIPGSVLEDRGSGGTSSG